MLCYATLIIERTNNRTLFCNQTNAMLTIQSMHVFVEVET